VKPSSPSGAACRRRCSEARYSAPIVPEAELGSHQPRRPEQPIKPHAETRSRPGPGRR
jgi:hypothetical protein